MATVRQRNPTHVVVRLCVCVLLFTSTLGAQEVSPRIVNGMLTSAFPTTGALLIYEDYTQTSFLGNCSGTLVGCRTFVTAAHCICDGTEAAECTDDVLIPPDRLRVFLQQAGKFRVTAAEFHPDFEVGKGGDIAVLTLAEAVEGITPSALNTIEKPAMGTHGTIVGFGTTTGRSDVISDEGPKRVGKMTVGHCGTLASDATHVCWQLVGGDASVCFGDSGGPLFIDFGNGPVLVGVASQSSSDTCEVPTKGASTDVFVYADWIRERIAAVADSCTNTNHQPLLTLLSTSGNATSQNRDTRFEFTVPADANALRVVVNGQLSSSFLDLYVRAGNAPTLTTYDCADADASSFGACEIPTPVAGTWNVLVHGFGTGVFQLNATALVASLPPPRCPGDCDENGVVKVDELVTGVNIALDRELITACGALDTNVDGSARVDELVAAVTSALHGCS